MTNTIVTDTCNLTLNLCTEERSILNRMAFEMGISLGELLRRLIVSGYLLRSKLSRIREGGVERPENTFIFYGTLRNRLGSLTS